MATLSKVYTGDGVLYTMGGGTSAELFENTATGNNLLKPFDGATGYYYDFVDGVTKKTNANCYCTDEKIYIAGASTVYIILKEVISASHTCCVYCYNGDTYFGYLGFSAAQNKSAVQLKEGTTHIRLYVGVVGGVTNVPVDNFCISTAELEAFEDYAGEDTLKRALIPKMSEDDALYTETIKALKHDPVYGDEILLFGDSIPATTAKPYDTATLIGNLTGANVYNCAVGGATMGLRSNGGYYNEWSMYRLAYAIANNEWTAQEENIGRAFERTILEHLKTVDFSKIDSIIIMYGYNDSGIDNSEDKYDAYTVGGALRYSIETILAAYPNIKIYPCTLTYNTNVPNNTVYAEKSQVIKDVAEEYHLKCIDLFNIGINAENTTQYFPTGDGVHFKVEGRQLVAKKVAKELF